MTTKAVGRKRLAKLADFLDTQVPRNNFDMFVFAENEKWDGTKKPVVTDCGTSACALGWATAAFPRHLKLELSPWGDVVHKETGAKGFVAAQAFFDLNITQSRELFDADFPCTPKQKARQIRKFIKSGA